MFLYNNISLCYLKCVIFLQAELAEQIAIKEREKINKRMAKQREEAIEEARLEEERQKLQQQYEKEAMEKRRKEVSTI